MEFGAATAVVDRRLVAGLAGVLAGGALPVDASGLAELLTGLEELKATASAVQARASVALADALVEEQRAAGVPAAQLGRGVGAAVALARRESPHAGGRWLGFARALTAEMPRTLSLLTRGVLSEYRATLLVRETACLTVADRRAVDEALCADPATVAAWGNRRLAAEARKLAYGLDPRASVERHARAVADRSVTLRPAPDAMTYLTALLPVQQGVACLAALQRAADGARAGGDPRSRGQAMADVLVERTTGQARADDVGVGVFLVMTDQALLGGGDGPAQVVDGGPLGGALARQVVVRALAAGDVETAGWVRRLFRAPGTGELVGLESRSRVFPRGLAALIRVRDQRCRTPWCDAPVRHLDHAVPHEDGGATSLANGQGLCEACNHAKQAPGWQTTPLAGPFAPVEVRGPTGQTVRTRAPDPPGLDPPALASLDVTTRAGPRPVTLDVVWDPAA